MMSWKSNNRRTRLCSPNGQKFFSQSWHYFDIKLEGEAVELHLDWLAQTWLSLACKSKKLLSLTKQRS
jgi:hypothetical protein